MVGQHVIIDMYGIDPDIINTINNLDKSIELWNNELDNVFKTANVNCLNISWHNFDRCGAFTALYLLAESHLSIHTWPEKKYIALDIFTCGESNIDLIVDYLIKYFNPTNKIIRKINRGLISEKINEQIVSNSNYFPFYC